jgi:hypothetical protein
MLFSDLQLNSITYIYLVDATGTVGSSGNERHT